MTQRTIWDILGMIGSTPWTQDSFLYARLKNGRIMPWQCPSVCPSVHPSIRLHFPDFFYASAFRRRRHYVFGLSVRPSGCPSVRSLKYPLLTCTWVRWSTRPTVIVLRHVRLSVHPSGEVSGHLPENAWREWPEILHADVSWPSSELISLWSWSVDFSNFGTILT